MVGERPSRRELQGMLGEPGLTELELTAIEGFTCSATEQEFARDIAALCEEGHLRFGIGTAVFSEHVLSDALPRYAQPSNFFVRYLGNFNYYKFAGIEYIGSPHTPDVRDEIQDKGPAYFTNMMNFLFRELE